MDAVWVEGEQVTEGNEHGACDMHGKFFLSPQHIRK